MTTLHWVLIGVVSFLVFVLFVITLAAVVWLFARMAKRMKGGGSLVPPGDASLSPVAKGLMDTAVAAFKIEVEKISHQDAAAKHAALTDAVGKVMGASAPKAGG